MCYAIIEVKYRQAGLSRDTFRIENETALQNRLLQLQTSDQVVSITIFKPEITMTRAVSWVADS